MHIDFVHTKYTFSECECSLVSPTQELDCNVQYNSDRTEYVIHSIKGGYHV